MPSYWALLWAQSCQVLSHIALWDKLSTLIFLNSIVQLSSELCNMEISIAFVFPVNVCEI